MKSTILFKKKGLLLLPLLFLFVQQTVFGQTSIPAIGTVVTQNFNSLASTGTGVVWTDGSTLPNWYAYAGGSSSPYIPTAYSANDGTLTTARLLCSYGASGNADRALGFIPGGNNGISSYIGWRFVNKTGQIIKQIKVVWTCEQWRYTLGATTQSMTLFYKINSYDLSTAGVSVGPANAPIITGATRAIDGNSPENRVTKTSNIAVTIAPEAEITLIWGVSKASNQDQLALDDVSVSAQTDQSITVTPVPQQIYGSAPVNLANYFTASSGLAVTYTSLDTKIATISGSFMNIVGPGNVTIKGDQAGNDNYAVATQVSQDIAIQPKAPDLDIATNISSTQFDATWTADNGLNDANTNYEVQYSTYANIDDDPSVLTISNITAKTATVPNLTPNSLYHYRVWANTDGLYGDFSQSFAVTTGYDYVSVQDGDWDVNNRWDVNSSPNPYGNKVTIQNVITAYNTARDSIVVNTLIIKPNGKLNNQEVINITGELIIESDATGKTGQILNMNAIHFGGAAKIIFRKSFSAAYGWYFMGFPYDVVQSKIYLGGTSTLATWGDPSTYDGTKDFYVYAYNGSKRDQTGVMNATVGLNWSDVSPHTFVAKQGYNVAVTSDKIIDFVTLATNRGSVFDNSATSTVHLYNTNPCGCHRSWNLVTTPFASSYDLSNSNEAPYYVYNHSTLGYDVFMSGESVSVYPYTAFFIQANTATMNFAQAGRVFKARSVDSDVSNFDELKLALSNDYYSDFTRVRFQDGASPAYEIGTDAAKFVSSVAAIPQIYTNISGFGVAVNTLPTTVNSFDLNTKIGTTGNYTITLTNPEKLKNYSAITLIDTELPSQAPVNLLTSSYTYTSSTTGTTTRFKVVLTPDVVNSVSNADNTSLIVSVSDNKVYVKGLTALADVNVYDSTGKLYKSAKKISNGQSIDLANKGIYILEVNSVEGKSRIKIINN